MSQIDLCSAVIVYSAPHDLLPSTQAEVASRDVNIMQLEEKCEQLEEKCEQLKEKCEQLEAQVSPAICIYLLCCLYFM